MCLESGGGPWGAGELESSEGEERGRGSEISVGLQNLVGPFSLLAMKIKLPLHRV